MGVGRNPMLATVIRVLAQTLVHGMFIFLMPMVSKVLLGQKFRAPCRTLFWLTLAAFILSTGYWALSVAFLIVMAEGTVPHYYDAAQTTFNAAILLNFLFADGVVVWRMYVLCALHFSRKILLVPILLYGMLCVSVLGTIVLRIAATATHKSPSTPFTVFQACGNILSLVTNLAATSIILVWAYQRHQTIKKPHNDSTHSNARLDRIVLAIVESGLVYCFFTATLVIVSDIHIPLRGSIVDIYKPVHAQIAGLYPSMVILIVHSKGLTQPNSAPNASSGMLSEDHAAQVMSFTDSQAPYLSNSRITV